MLSSVRPGVDGVANALAGYWSQPFDVLLTVHLETGAEVLDLINDQADLIGETVNLIWEETDYEATFLTKYRILAVDNPRIKKVLRFISPDKDMTYPTMVQARFNLQPIYIGP
jgi:hypothetical protein